MGGKNIFKSVFKRIYIPVKKLCRWFMNLKTPAKVIVAAFLAFVLVDIFVCWYFFTFGTTTSVKLESLNTKKAYNLTALNPNAHKGWVKKSGAACFKFTDEDKILFKDTLRQEGSVSLVIRLKFFTQKKNQEENVTYPLYFGLLNGDDFTEKGRFISSRLEDDTRLMVSGSVPDNGVLDLSIALNVEDIKNEQWAEGFFIYSGCKTRIIAACVKDAVLGFDRSKEIPFYGFAFNGGKIDYFSKSFDFSYGSSVFKGNQTKVVLPPPVIEVKFYDDISNEAVKQMKSTLEKSVYVGLNVNGEQLYINNPAAASKIAIPLSAVNNPYGGIVSIGQNHQCTDALLMHRPSDWEQKVVNLENADVSFDDSEVLVPVLTDPGLILNYPRENWRNENYEIYEWDRYSRILFFDISTLSLQEKFFSRLAYFVEKEGYKGTLLTNQQLEGKHGYNAHDYSAESMANFFNKAREENFTLNYEELLLKKILIANGFFTIENGYVVPHDGGIVSISRETPDWSRRNLLAHEGWHTIFFRDEEFRNFVAAVYGTIDYDSRQFLIDYFKSQPQLGYDISDEYLMHNEFMAYIMQQPVKEVPKYFMHLAQRGSVRAATPYLCDYILNNNAVAFEDCANILNDFVFDRYGITCGNISLIRWLSKSASEENAD